MTAESTLQAERGPLDGSAVSLIGFAIIMWWFWVSGTYTGILVLQQAPMAKEVPGWVLGPILVLVNGVWLLWTVLWLIARVASEVEDDC